VQQLEPLIPSQTNSENFDIGGGASFDLSYAGANQHHHAPLLSEILVAVNKLALDQKNFQKLIVRHLVNLSSDVSEVIRIVSQNTTLVQLEELEIPGIIIPLNTVVEFHLLGQWLALQENKADFVKYLKGIGGGDIDVCEAHFEAHYWGRSC
ncbi:unnamed protein product, partial [Allacma fusca]